MGVIMNSFEFETEMSKNIFKAKYMFPDETETNQPVERIISVVRQYFPEIADELKEAIYRKWLGPAGGLWRAARNPSKKISSINCTTLDQPEDTLESIAEAWYWWAKFSAYGQGEGIDLSKLRPKGSAVHNSSKESTGAVSFMKTFDGILSTIAQQGRRGASLISLHISHPDIPDFVTVKDEEGVLESANISIHITDEFMNAVKNDEKWEFVYENEYEKIEKKTSAKQLFSFIAQHAWKSGDPGVQFIDIVRKYSNSDYLGHPVISTNACSFTEDTLVTTKEGIFPIKNLAEKEFTIFDGENWVKNSGFKVTGHDQDIYRVTLQNGVYFDVTKQHRFFTEKGEEKRTYELNVGDRLEYDLENAIYEGNHHEKGAYLKGFLLGDGNIHDEGCSKGPRPQLWLYSPKYCCFPRLKNSFEEMAQDYNAKNLSILCELKEFKSSGNSRGHITGLTSVERDTLYKWCNEYKQKLPTEVFNWDNQSKLDLIAGLFDADGVNLNNKKGFGYQLASIHEDFLIDILRLMATMGIYGRVSQMKKEGTSNIKGTEYQTKAVYRLTIPQKYAIELSKLVSFERLLDFSNRSIKRNSSFKYNKIISIKKLEGKADKVYCTHVESTSRFMVNTGIITGNSEQWLDAHNVCLLSSVNLAKFYEFGREKYPRMIQLVTYMLEAFRRYEIEESRSPSPLQLEKLEKLPRIGVGVTGLADYFIDKKIKYASKESIGEVRYLFSTLASEAYKTSYEIAKKEGKSFEYYDKEKYKKSPFVKRLLDEGLIEDYHLDYQAHVCKTTIAPNGSLTEIMEAGGGGVEPIFAPYFMRRERATTNEWKEWPVMNHAVRHYLESKGLEVTKENADMLKKEEWFITAHDLDNNDKIEMMSEIQKYIDSAISITYNLPNNATPEDIENIYFKAWKKEIKAVAVYRDGSKTGILVTTNNDNKQRYAKKRPEILPCEIYEMQIDKNRVIALVGLLDDRPYEVFLTDDPDDIINVKHAKIGNIAKVKTGKYDLHIESKRGEYILHDISSVFDDEWGTLGRLVSMSLRHNVPLQFIVDQLSKTRKFNTFSKGMARVLKKYIKDGEKALSANKCPECGNELVFIEGCKSCPQCGFSKCD